jgi:aminoglycoside phosphotransferase (APT) family kinase protein
MIEAELTRCVASWCPGATGVTAAAKLSGGASQETWTFDIVHPDGNIGAILRRAPEGYGAAPSRAVGLENEAILMRLAFEAGVPSPRVLHVLRPEDDLGTGFIMQRVEGETIARKILRDEQFTTARPLLARQLGAIAAGIHGLPRAKLPVLREMSSTREISDLENEYRSFNWPRPVFELALRWLRDHDPGPSAEVTLVHGDFRHGNLIIGADGVRAVLDWELAHLGDPMEDLGWVCVNSWRFGAIDKPVGGFGSREELFAGYEAAGRKVDPARVTF